MFHVFFVESFMWVDGGPFPVCCWYSPVCGEPFARVWWIIRPCVVEHSPVCGCAFAVVHIRPMWFHSPCGCARVCVWLVIRLCVVVAFARVWLSIRPCVVDHSPVCGSSKTNPTSRICNIVKGWCWREEENRPFSVRVTLPTRFTTMLGA